MIKNIKEIETALGLKEGQFNDMLTSTEEVEIPLSDLEIVRKVDLAQRINNISIANYEKNIKEAGRNLGFEKPVRDIDSFAKELENKITSNLKVEPNQKISELEGNFQAVIKKLQERDLEIEKINSNHKKEKESQLTEKILLSELPEQDKIILPREDLYKLATLPNSVYDQFTFENGNLIFKKDGEVLKNQSTFNPLTAKEIMPKFIEKYIKPAQGGGGGEDRVGGNGAGTLEAFDKEMVANGVRIYSEDYNKEKSKRYKAGLLSL